MVRRPAKPLCLAIALVLGCVGFAGIEQLSIARAEAAIFGTTAPKAGRYIIVVNRLVNVDSFATKEVERGVKVHSILKLAVRGYVADLSVDDISRLRSDRDVMYLERSQKLSITEYSWGQDRLNQRELPLDSKTENSLAGAGVNAYIIDTGIEPRHSEFGDRVVAGFSAIGGDTKDCNGHGTHVAGTVGGEELGVAPRVTLVPIRVLNCSGSGDIDGVISGINWVIAHHQNGESAVANMSLGAGKSQVLNDAVDAAVADGITFAVAAGNSNADACNTSPASTKSAITVGATNKYDFRAPYSNFGKCVDVFAPGSDILSANYSDRSGFQVLSGTSMASPHVAGVAALYLGDRGYTKPADVASALISGSSKNVVRNAGNDSPNALISTLAITDPDQPSPANPPPNQETTTTTSSWRPVPTTNRYTTTVPTMNPPQVNLSISGRDLVIQVDASKSARTISRIEVYRGVTRVGTAYRSEAAFTDEGKATSYMTVTYTVKVVSTYGSAVATSASVRVRPPSAPRVDERGIYSYKVGSRYTFVVPYSSYYSGDQVAIYCNGKNEAIAVVSARTGKITVSGLYSSLYGCHLWGLSESGAAQDYQSFDLRRS